MREFELGRDVRWGDELPSFDELKRTVVEEKRREEPSFTVSRAARRGRRRGLIHRRRSGARRGRRGPVPTPRRRAVV
jgi:hypothetical protein